MPDEFLLDNVNVESIREIPSPAQVHARLPLTDTAARTVARTVPGQAPGGDSALHTRDVIPP